MKILALHCDYIEFEAKKPAISKPEEYEKGKDRVEEALVML